MKASFAMLVATATLAIASPLNKRKYVTEYDTEIVTSYVYPNGSPAPPPATAIVADMADTKADTKFDDDYDDLESTKSTTTTAVVSTPTAITVEVPSLVEAPVPTTSSSASVYVTTVVYEESSSTTAVSFSTSIYIDASSVATSTKTTETKSTASVATATASVSSVIDRGLLEHNQHRVNHSVDALEWDDNLATYAMTSAQNCIFEHDLSPGGGGYGQNIAMYGSSSAKLDAGTAIAQAVTNMWYNGEVSLYPGYNGEPDMGNFDEWGHYSQLVWKNTQKVGCASYKCPAGTMSSLEAWFTVCNYSPPGNYGGEYADNVKAPLGMLSITVDV